MAVNWRVADSLDHLLGQLNELAPKRSKVSDGAIGDADHQNRTSDHNPWWQFGGQHYVTARDFTHDPAGGLDCHTLADALVRSRDQRIKYVIWNRHICAGAGGPSPWQWRTYSGANPHTSHLHLSVVPDLRSLTRIDWQLALSASAVPTSPLLLRRGSRGPEVRKLQQVLNAWYPREVRLAVDGVFGPATEAAVRMLQHRAGLVVDGIVGPRTRAVLRL